MHTQTILGVKFFNGTPAEAVAAGLQGGLVVVPSAPVLVDVADKPALREAVLGADLAITDSGLMVLLWWLLKREKLERVSGLEYLKLLLERLRTQPQLSDGRPVAPRLSDESYSLSGLGDRPVVGVIGNELSVIREKNPDQAHVKPITHNAGPITENASGVFWVMPTAAARDQNLAWLRSQGFTTTADDCYVAPMYAAEGPLSDDALLSVIRERRPAHIILALGGGVQERVGYALRQALAVPRLSDGGYSLSGGRPAVGELSDEGSDAGKLADRSYSLSGAITNNPSEPVTNNSAARADPDNKEPVTNNRPAYRPGIHCIGAAIGFLSGEQVRIPLWVDYLYLGWLWRSVSAPTKFVPRYWKAVRLIPMMIRYGAKAPVADG
jgi:hypothetical protein